MKYLVLLALAIAVCGASDVLEFDDSNFATKISQHSIALVEFFAPWCGHCKKLAPEYEIAATQLKKLPTPISLVKVDCTVNTAVCGKYGVTGYPTLKIFKGGEMSEDYQGPRQADGIVKTMKSKAGPSSFVLNTVEDADKFISGTENVVIGFFSDASSDLAKEHQKTANTLSEKYMFAHTNNADVLEKHGYSDEVVLFRAKKFANKFEDAQVKFEGSPAALRSWIAQTAHGICGHRTSENQDQFSNPLVVAYYDVDYVKNIKGTNYWRNRVMKVAKKIAEGGANVNFAVSNAKDFVGEMGEFGLDVGGSAVQVAARDNKGLKYSMKEEFSMDNLEAFVTALDAGTLEPHIKSEAVPASNDGPVKVVVGRNFDEIVNDPDRDVLIEFYAPWCGHCKSLEPKYNELGEKLSEESGVTIAKMDATANDVPPTFEVRGFPTIYFAPKGSKGAPRKYEGGREVNDFIKYLAKEATGGLKGYDKDGKKKKVEL